MVTLFISKWDGRCNWLQTTAEHDVIWSIWAGGHGELSCAHLNRERQFHVKSCELIGTFLACPPDWAWGPPLLRDERGLPLPSCQTIVPILRILFSRLSMLSSFKPVRQFTQQPSCTILLCRIETFNQNCIFLWNFHDFVYFFLIFRSWQFPKVK